MPETHVNFYGGSPLNRLSWLRSSTPFLETVVRSPNTRWLLLHGGQPLVTVKEGSKIRSLAELTTSDVKPILGQEPYFQQGQHPGERAKEEVAATEASRLHGPKVVFLGLKETQELSMALPSSEFSAKGDANSAAANIAGIAYFSLDVSDIEQSELDKLLQSAELAKEEGLTLQFMEPRGATATFDQFEAAVLAEARSITDWNSRNAFCPSCGSPNYSTWSGWKLTCTTLLPWADNTGKKPCPSGKGLHNFAHPRTDPVVIVAVIDEAGEKILLGRSRKFPTGFYSTLAGFIEPGESFEDAVKREIWEEAGVRVWGVTYHSGQPWPYPASLMVGMYAYADPTLPIRIDLDNELEDARWYTRAEIHEILAHPQGATLTRKDYKKFTDEDEKHSYDAKPAAQSEQKPSDADSEAPRFRVPPLTAIAGVLISDWANGKLGNVTTRPNSNL